MAKLPRVNQKLFGLTGPLGDFGVFGSKKNQPQTFTQDPDLIQSLAAFQNGWGDAIIGTYEPPLEDMNSLFLLAFRQLAYIFQSGTPEWITSAAYYIGSMVNVAGTTYISLVDNNTGNTPGAVGSTVWQAVGNVKGADIASSTSITLGADGTMFKVTGSTDIATINNPNGIPLVQLLFSGVLNVLTTGNIILNNGALQTIVNGTLTLSWNGTKWVEVTRAPINVPTPTPQVGFGAWTSANLSQQYTAATDGFVLAYQNSSGDNNIQGYTPVANIRVSVNEQYQNTGRSFVFMPVRKGDTWRIDAAKSMTIWWLPLGV